MGKLIVIEGSDGSGKQTQTERLYKRLKNENKKIKLISFPNYESKASEPIKMYLRGEFGDNVKEINPYPISTMYAIDRYASFNKEWGNFYQENGIVVSDRYTTSNMIHQGAKIKEYHKKIEYLNWLKDLEYNKIALPIPDIVIFLNMPTKQALELISNRENKITGKKEKDIHEKDIEYMKKSYENSLEIAKIENWYKIECVNEEGQIKSIEEIHNEVYHVVKDILEK
ncbi:dTMP kinase [Hypnocyclicus thermotrophus]|uniref:Thymidylate kinase n=1 Tax=Hypnocyclicus thermotrophus TaxID=1627895 RepID=A0AA46DZD3_9FUSO|nr:thymidylate kinase [Hypnocyclicus thermotrophus]TDT70645.1 dTMP kinase [Hypnocyclicus thermotrophus]